MITLDKIQTKYSPIGLDIGTYGIRAAQVEYKNQQYNVTNTFSMNRPATQTSNVSTLHERINTCIRRGEFHGRHVITTPIDGSLEYYPLDLPENIFGQQPENINQAIRWELGRIMNGTPDDMSTAYWKLPASKTFHHNAIGVAIQSNQINRTLDQCSMANLACSCIDTPMTALCRLGCALNQWKDNDIWGMLDVGADQCRLIICVDDTPVLVRTAGSGSKVWTQRIAESLSLGEKSAEIHKIEHGIANVSSPDTSTLENELSTIFLGLLKSDLNEIATEIKKSYEYILGCYPSRKAAELILVGGGCELIHLPEYLNSVLGISVQRASQYLTLEGCSIHLHSDMNCSLNVMGLAIGLTLGSGNND